jgi:hypothetical protein
MHIAAVVGDLRAPATEFCKKENLFPGSLPLCGG